MFLLEIKHRKKLKTVLFCGFFEESLVCNVTGVIVECLLNACKEIIFFPYILLM